MSDSLFQQANIGLQEIHFHLRSLENAMNESAAQPILQTLNLHVNELKTTLNRLDGYISKEPPAKRRTSRFRYDQLKYDYDTVSVAINALQMKLTAKWRATADREELLTRRFKPNETFLDVGDSEYLINDKLKQSSSAIDSLISQGSAVLSSLRTQHMELRGVKTKVLGIGQTLGLSTTTLRVIEKRLDEDWIIFLVLCVVCLIFMYCFYRYWKG